MRLLGALLLAAIIVLAVLPVLLVNAREDDGTGSKQTLTGTTATGLWTPVGACASRNDNWRTPKRKEICMKIQLGKHVVTVDGTNIGTVDRLVVDPRLATLLEIIVHKGAFLRHDRIIEPWVIDHVGADGTVHLRVTGAQAEDLPLFVEEEYVTPLEPEMFPPPAGPFRILWPASYEPEHYGRYGDEKALFESAPFDAPVVEVRTNLPPNSVAVRRRVEVVASDGSKLGALTSITVDPDDTLTGITVRVGHLGDHREIEFPAAMIAFATHDKIALAAPSPAGADGRSSAPGEESAGRRDA